MKETSKKAETFENITKDMTVEDVVKFSNKVFNKIRDVVYHTSMSPSDKVYKLQKLFPNEHNMPDKPEIPT